MLVARANSRLRVRDGREEVWSKRLCGKNAGAADLLDPAFGGFAEELGLDDEGDFGQLSFSEHLEVALERFRGGAYCLCDVDDRRLVLLLLGVLARLLRDEAPQFVQVDRRAPLRVRLQVEVPDSLLSEHSGMAAHKNRSKQRKKRSEWRGALTILGSGFSDGGSRRRFHDRPGAFGAFQFDHGRLRRGRASCGSSLRALSAHEA